MFKVAAISQTNLFSRHILLHEVFPVMEEALNGVAHEECSGLAQNLFCRRVDIHDFILGVEDDNAIGQTLENSLIGNRRKVE